MGGVGRDMEMYNMGGGGTGYGNVQYSLKCVWEGVGRDMDEVMLVQYSLKRVWEGVGRDMDEVTNVVETCMGGGGTGYRWGDAGTI